MNYCQFGYGNFPFRNFRFWPEFVISVPRLTTVLVAVEGSWPPEQGSRNATPTWGVNIDPISRGHQNISNVRKRSTMYGNLIDFALTPWKGVKLFSNAARSSAKTRWPQTKGSPSKRGHLWPRYGGSGGLAGGVYWWLQFEGSNFDSNSRGHFLTPSWGVRGPTWGVIFWPQVEGSGLATLAETTPFGSFTVQR